MAKNFYDLGNNCKLLGLDQEVCKTLLENEDLDLTHPEGEDYHYNDADNFWYGFVYGTNKEIVSI